MRALIIEDESLIAMTIEECLRDLGFLHFVHAAAQQEAVEAARVQKPDLITADFALKEGTGLAAVEAISQFAPCPVIYVTATPERVQPTKDPIVAKPFATGELARAIEKVLRDRN